MSRDFLDLPIDNKSWVCYHPHSASMCGNIHELRLERVGRFQSAMFQGEFNNAADAGKFINACLDLYEKLGDTKVISKRIKPLFPDAFKFFTDRDGAGTTVNISEDELRDIVVRVFKHNTRKFMSMKLGGNYELHKPMERELAIEHRRDLKALLGKLPDGLEAQVTKDLVTFRNLL